MPGRPPLLRHPFFFRCLKLCGRFTLRAPAAAWTQDFLPLWSEEQRTARASEHAIASRYNIAPTQNVSCIHTDDDGRRRWSLFRWGLVPSWANDLAIGNRMINARSETVHEKRSFKKAFFVRRCLIPADGYYEWKKTSAGKQPYLIQRPDARILAMAGIWESNLKLVGDGEQLNSFTILTTAANQTTRSIHDRMPVFLEGDDRSTWLDPDLQDPDILRSLLRPAPNDRLTAFPVATIVNSPRNDVPQCVDPIELPSDSHRDGPDNLPAQRDLF